MQRALAMAHVADPKEEITAKLASYVEDITPLGAQVLIAQYMRPEKTTSGIYLVDKTREEDQWQGKIGLIVKCGPLAFEEDADHRWGENAPKVGDWVMFRTGDAWPFILNDHPCRMIEDVAVKAIVTRPDSVF